MSTSAHPLIWGVKEVFLYLIEFEASRETVAWPRIPQTLAKEAARIQSYWIEVLSSYQAVWKQDAQLLKCAEEHGFETPWAFVDPDKVQVILAVTKAR